MIASATLLILTLMLIFIFGTTSLQTTSSDVIIKTANLRQRQLATSSDNKVIKWPDHRPPELESRTSSRNLQISDRAEEALGEVGIIIPLLISADNTDIPSSSPSTWPSESISPTSSEPTQVVSFCSLGSSLFLFILYDMMPLNTHSDNRISNSYISPRHHQ